MPVCRPVLHHDVAQRVERVDVLFRRDDPNERPSYCFSAGSVTSATRDVAQSVYER